MKGYNKYMDEISVSNMLHQKILLCVDIARPKRRFIMFRRYKTAFACLTLVLLGVFTITRFLHYDTTLSPSESASVLQPGSKTPASGTAEKYALYFNKADSQTAAKIAIRGHFWQELTDEELKAVFPRLTETHTVTATANFRSDESGASLFNIEAQAVSSNGLKSYIQLAPGEVVLDYGFDIEAKASDVLGTAVTAGCSETEPNSKGIRSVIYFATFKLSEIAYYVELGGVEAEKESLKDEVFELTVLLISGGSADLSILHPEVPELREDRLTLDEARLDPDFGLYLPRVLPEGFVFEDAFRFINQERNGLNVYWSKGMEYIDWCVSYLDENDRTRITNVSDSKNYDLALYPVPRAATVPDELRKIVDNPIFMIEELTLDTVNARTYEVSDSGDVKGPRMRFSVLYGDILVDLSAKGVSPETMFKILKQR